MYLNGVRNMNNEISKELNISEKSINNCKNDYDQLLKIVKENINKNQFAEALEIIDNSGFADDCTIQLQKVLVLIKLGRGSEALKIAERKEFADESSFQFLKIKYLVKCGELEEALKITEKEAFINDVSIQSLKINILILKDELEEALKIINRKEFQAAAPIQSQRIKYLVIKGKLNEALKIAEKEEYSDNVIVQSQRINILIKQGKMAEVLKIIENEKFELIEPIQSEKIKYLFRNGNLNEALKITEKKEFLQSIVIQSQRITVLLKLGRIKKALEITEQKHFLMAAPIQSQRITILLKLGKINEALKITERSEFLLSESIQSQRIKILLKIGKINQALEITERKEFFMSIPIQSQKINILAALGRIDEALIISNRKKFKNDKYFKEKRAKLLELNSQTDICINESIEKIDSTNIKKIDISNFLTRIYWQDISIDEINMQEIDNFEKALLKIAYYEKNNKKLGIKFIKEQKKMYSDNKEKLKILNILLNRLTNNKIMIFDISIYTDYLNCDFNFELGLKISKDNLKKEKECIVITKNEHSLSIDKKIDDNLVEVKEIPKVDLKKVNIICNDSKEITISHKKKIVKEKKQNDKEILIKSIFEKEIFQLGTYLYIKMHDYETRKKAIMAWDNLQILIEKPVSDQKTLNKIIRIFEVLEKDRKCNFQIDSKRYLKYKK